jgi:hypothetical protein
MKIYAALAMIFLPGAAASHQAVGREEPSLARVVFYVQ